MIETRIYTGEEPLDKLLEGSRKLCDAVKVTMGPRGGNVIIRKHHGRAFVTHDGVTVSRSVKLMDPAEDMAAELMREAASKLDATTGDGTTTVTVLAYNLLAEAAVLVKQGENPMAVRNGLFELEKIILDGINKVSRPVTKANELVNVASVAAGDPEIGRQVGEAVFSAGVDTPFNLGFSEGTDTRIETIAGIKLPVGPASPYLMDQGAPKTEIRSAKIVLVDGKLRTKEDIAAILRAIATFPDNERNILLVASEIAADALTILSLNHVKEALRIAIARVPQEIGSHTEYLQDIAVMTGAKVMAKNGAFGFMSASPQWFGNADLVQVQTMETLIIGAGGAHEDIVAHAESLKAQREEATNTGLKTFLDNRIKFLNQTVLSIYVGGQSASEAEEKHYRYEDALGASFAALRHGFVPGGGTLLLDISKTMPDTEIGIAVANALVSPISVVLENAGERTCEYDKVGAGFGYDVTDLDAGIVDLIARGIVDPTESELTAVQTAMSIAGLLLTSGGIIVDNEISENKHEAKFQTDPN